MERIAITGEASEGLDILGSDRPCPDARWPTCGGTQAIGSVAAYARDGKLRDVPDTTPADDIMALLTLSARRPLPAGITFDVKSAKPIVPCTRTCFSPPIGATCSGGMSTTASPLALSGFQ